VQLAFLTMTNIRHFWVASNSCLPMQTIKTMWKAIFQNKLTIYKANLPSFIQNIIKSRCYVDLSRRLRLKCHPKMAVWERLIKTMSVMRTHAKIELHTFIKTLFLCLWAWTCSILEIHACSNPSHVFSKHWFNMKY
jgi:hypothetical protein